MVYVLAILTPNPDEPEALENYKRQAKIIRDEYGAELVLRLNVKEQLLGSFEGESIRILKFPSADHVRKWLTDPRYLETVPLRERGYRQVTITLLEE
ncbi:MULTISPECIES: DUF1330 domain-containing protein [Fischerella]|uniref:DUF1330 domain-containing protein n=1 Tax=Fischerella muscicola CCMEE 5323 TaxID=2019572 RepID=A0A2N6K8I5_FISMU|nr:MULTISPECIES: DUF1330 domain-containing protein [Fischerella]MBD2434889.1 DUF1330 domain-containing protein [Fischerella sp. FACHB-380]PLZ93885.1 DUF1330 domain-containing protein [Fischerella muscicola CCMEE 5323]